MSPLRGVTGCGTCRSRAKAACSSRWRRSPWVGTAICGRAHWYICASSSRRVAGDVDARVVALGVEPHAAVGRAVLQVADRDLVARDHPRGEDRRRRPGPGSRADGCRRRCATARRAARPGCRCRGRAPCRRGKCLASLLVDEGLDVLHQAHRLGGRGHPVHRAADQADAAAIGLGGADDGVHRAPRWRRSRPPRPCPSGRPISSVRLSRTSASEPASPSTKTLVESQTMASTPSSPSRRMASSSVTRAEQRIGIDLPVAGVQDRAERRADRQAVGLGDRVGERDQVRCSNGPSSIVPPSGTSVIGHSSSRSASRSFSRSRKAVKGVA